MPYPRWFDLAGATVGMITFDYSVILLFGDSYRVIIETPFTIARPGALPLTVVPESVEDPAAVLAALHQEGIDTIGDSSELIVRLANATWTIFPDDNYESWHVLGDDMHLNCPGGGLW